MKLYITKIALSLFLLSGNFSFGQVVHYGNIDLSTQAEVNAFGAIGYTKIDGNLRFISSSDITDLSSLTSIDSIIGELVISHNNNLTTLEGLDNIMYVSNRVNIQKNSSLTDVTGLSGLAYVENSLSIDDNFSLDTIAGFTNLNSLKRLLIIDNPNLLTISGFTSLTMIEEFMTIKSNESLLSIPGFSDLTTVTDDLRISNNISLSDSLSGFSSLTTVGGFFEIKSNYALPSLSGLSNLTYVGEDFRIWALDITSLNGLSNLQTVGSEFLIRANSSLNTLSGVDNLKYVYGDFNIRYCDNLNSLDGLDSLASVGSFILLRNDGMYNLTGAPNLTTIYRHLYIYDNTNLHSLSGLENLLYINVFGSFYDFKILENQNLTNYCALDNVIANGGYGTLECLGNAYNPSEDDLLEGKCKEVVSTQTEVICEGEEYIVGNSVYNTAGNFLDTITTTLGYDSIIHLNLSINTLSEIDLTEYYCNGESFTIGNTTYSNSALYSIYLTGSNGCDSIINLELIVENIDLNISVNGHNLEADQVNANYQWLNCSNYSLIDLATEQNFTALENGEFAVEITKNGCVDTTDCFSIEGIGLVDLQNSDFAVLPNPFNTTITIDFHLENETGQVRLLNNLGQLMIEQQIDGQEMIIETSDLSLGSYYLIINSNSGVKTVKLIK